MSNNEHDSTRRDPISVIGAACRLPGASNPEAFWELLAAGRDTVSSIPPERFEIKDTGRYIASDSGGYLRDIEGFDAKFFGISPHEAARFDPQLRLLLETTWEALDDAGIPAPDLAGSRTGVFAGSVDSGYWDLLRSSGVHDMHAAAGSGSCSVLAGRLSFLLDTRGPAFSVDVSCATSLTALHLACRALWYGDIDLAIVGGANLILTPDLHISLSEGGFLSPNGRSRFGDATADGYVRSEGVVSLVLKRHSDAIEDGDLEYASILGSAMNNDGRSGGTYMTPGAEGKEALLRSAYRDAGVDPADIDYVEAHGPGTELGDAAELSALNRVLSDGRPTDAACFVGSAKSNIGHTEPTAGLVGVLKTALSLKHRVIPATLHVDTPNPVLLGAGSRLRLPTSTTPFAQRDRPLLAGVSAFGLSGVNVHMVLTEPSQTRPRAQADRERTGYLLPLSANSVDALRALAADYADLLTDESAPVDEYDVCFSAATRRAHHNQRLAVTGRDRKDLADRLRGFSDGTQPAAVSSRGSLGSRQPRVVFVFSGQGSQWAGMCRELLVSNPLFAQRFRECDEAIQEELGWSAESLLRNETELSTADVLQPTMWAVQVALAAVWRDLGVEPDLLIGHSQGEIAAATASGALSVRDGAAVICRRNSLLSRLRNSGAMWAVQLGAEDARAAIGEFADRVCVGVINSRHSTVLSGDPAALDEVVAPLMERGIFCRKVRVDYASHSPHTDLIRDDLTSSLAQLKPGNAHIPMYSTAYDRIVDGHELDGTYWAANLRLPVRFESAVTAAMTGERPTLFIEISSHPVLLPAIEDGIEAGNRTGSAVPTLVRDQPEWEALLSGLGTAYTAGCSPDWKRLYEGGRFVRLPAYPWQRRAFWAPSRTPDRGSFTRHDPTVPAPDQALPGSPADPADLAAPDVIRRIRHCAATVLETTPEDVPTDVPLTTAGLDSLLAVRLRARIRDDLGIDVPARKFLGEQTLDELAGELHDGRHDKQVA